MWRTGRSTRLRYTGAVTRSPRELVVATSSAVYGLAVRVAGDGPAAEAAVRGAYDRAFEQLAGFGGSDAAAWVCGFITGAPHPVQPVPMPRHLLEELLDQADDLARRDARRLKPHPVLAHRATRARRRRVLGGAVVGVVVAAAVAGFVWRSQPAEKPLAGRKSQRPPGPEPGDLQPGALLVDSFGQGPAVDWPQQESKRLTFVLPRASVAVLYFDGIDASVDLNGQPLDVRTDVLAQELLLPMTTLRTGENVLTFQAGGDEPAWRIENLWLYTLELQPGEEGHPEQIVQRRLRDLNGYQDPEPLAGFRASHDACLLGKLSDCAHWEWHFEHQLDALCETALQRGEQLGLYDRPDVGCFRKVRAFADRRPPQ